MPSLRSWPPAFRILLPTWLLSLILLPVLRWNIGDAVLPAGVTVAVVLQSLAVLAALIPAPGWSRTLGLLAPLLTLAWLAEFVGSRTGVPFGRYHYTDLLQPQLAGVPLLIPLAWWMMLPPAWAVARVIAPRNRLAFAALGALAFTAWDLYLDPQMVGWGLWVWETPGAYFGIPPVNFLGWWLVSFGIGWLLFPLSGDRLPVSPLLAIYALTWVMEFIGQLFFWDLPGPAVCGFLGMGLMLFWAWRMSRR